MTTKRTGTLSVPGATIYYQLQGAGPLLVLIQGGAGNADGTAGIASHLTQQYQVLTYDRRGLARSTLDDGSDLEWGLEVHADDVHELLAAVTSEPVLVFGTSIGALIGLELLTHHPKQVHLLIAHEPPAPEVLPEPARGSAWRFQEEVEEIYAREGVPAAMKTFTEALLDFRDREPGLVLAPPDPKRGVDLAFFFGHDAPAARKYHLDLPGLRRATARSRLVLGGGETSRKVWPYQCAQAIAHLLDVEFVEFPGGHNGWMLQPTAFAARLAEVLG
jgi:pimeloyl-ACP methyl ester carboxylesterase